MPRVFVSVGSNIDREHNIRSGLRVMRSLYAPLESSQVYESEPVGFEGDRFYNLVVAFHTDSGLQDVVSTLQDIERQHGRIRGAKRFESRTLDLDVLLYGNLARHQDGIELPRPEINEYAFVLRPLSELAPTLRHPQTGLTFAECWRKFTADGQDLWPVEFEC